MRTRQTTLTAALTAALTASLLALPTLAPAQESPAVAEAKAWYGNVTVEGTTDAGLSFKAFHRPDGTVSAVIDSQHKSGGTWKAVEPGHICVAWDVPAWGKNPCYAIVKEGDGELWKLVRVDNPRMFVKVKRLPGNAFGM